MVRYCGVVALLCAGAMVGSAGAAEREGRAYRMGFTPFPHDATVEAMGEMRAFVKGNGDLLCVHLEGVPWAEAASGAAFHPKMMEEWKGKLAARPEGGEIYLALTPIDQGRRGLAAQRSEKEGMVLPKEFAGKSFDDPLVKRAYLAYCRRAVEYFRPTYLAIGIEANELFHHARGDWQKYAALHRYVYGELKKEWPGMLVFASVTLHNLLNEGWRDRKEMLAAFGELMDVNDVVAVSFYPFLAGLSGKVEESLGLLEREFDRYGKPYAFAESGQIAERLVVPSMKLTIEGSEAGQAEFVGKVLGFAQRKRARFVVAFLYRDYDAMWERIKGFSPEAFVVWRDCGLLDEKGRKRRAYGVWREAFETRYRGR